MAAEVVQQCRIAIKNLKDVSSGTKGLADPEIRQLRETVRETCLKVLQVDYEKAQRDDVERKLWRFAFYLPIGEFRSRLASPSISDQLKAKTLAAYLKFLDDAVSYYHTLVGHLSFALDKASLGPSLSNSINKDGTATATAAAPNTTPLQSSLRTSFARCYICIGDLRRYHAAASSTLANDPTTTTTTAADVIQNDNNAKNEEEEKAGNATKKPSPYSSARQAYAAAVGIDPRFGNAYNQLAVLDELDGDTLASAFFYLRAQCALTPFPLGHQNVALLFGAAVTAENTAAAIAAGGAGAAAAAGNKKARKEYFTPKKTAQQQRGSMPTPLLEKEIISKYLALAGCLYEKIDVDTTPLRLSTAGGYLDELLTRIKQQTGSGGVAKCARRVAQELHAMPTSVQAAMEQRPVSLIVLLTVIPLLLIQIFEDSLTLPSSNSGSGGNSSNLTASAAARGYSISCLLDILSRLLIAATKLRLTTKGPIGDAALTCPVFAAISVVLRWLVVRKAQPALSSISNLEPTAAPGAAAVAVDGEEEPPVAAEPNSILDILSNVEKTVSGLNSSRISFWKACTALSLLLPSTGVTTVVDVSEEEGKMALISEDYLLTGFTPLLKDPITTRVLESVFSSGTAAYTWDESDPGRPAWHRARRIWHDVQILASHAQDWLQSLNKMNISTTTATAKEGSDSELIELKQAVNEFVEAVNTAIGGSRQPTTNKTEQTAPPPPVVDPDDDDDDNEEEIVFAPLSAARRSNSAALLNSGGNSGRSTPAPVPVPVPPAAAAAEKTTPISTQRAVKQTSAITAAAGINDTAMGEGEEEDPQEAMERTGYAMAATVLSSDDAEIQMLHNSSGGGGGGDGNINQLPPIPAPPAPSSGLLGTLMFGNINRGSGYTTANTEYGGTGAGGALLLSSWQQQLPQHPQQQLAGSGVPPPFPSSALIGGGVGQHQEPAEGLRAVLFGGNMQQQQQQPPPSGTGGGGGGLWR